MVPGCRADEAGARGRCREAAGGGTHSRGSQGEGGSCAEVAAGRQRRGRVRAEGVIPPSHLSPLTFLEHGHGFLDLLHHSSKNQKRRMLRQCAYAVASTEYACQVCDSREFLQDFSTYMASAVETGSQEIALAVIELQRSQR